MNEIKIYLNPSGSTAELYKDFSLYQYCYRNVQITIYVPTAILYENADGTFLNAVKTGAILTAPNGAKVTTKSFNAEYVKTVEVNGVEYAVYTQLMPKEFVLYVGTQTIVCNVFNMDNTNVNAPKIISVTTSQVVSLTVLESAYLDNDEPLDPTEAEVIEGLINSLNKRLDNGEYATRALYPWNAEYTYGIDELVFYPNYGEHGVLLKSLQENNSEAPYVDGVFNSAFWEEVTDFNILNGLYGLKTELEEAAQSAQDNATAAGQSASSAESAAQTATIAAERLDGVTTYIEAVKDGATAVPKAVSDGAGNDIANQFATVNSDIEGLREDIANEAHFRGYLETNVEIQALSGTPNDFAYSAQSGTVWIYQTATGWTNSEKPVPDQVIPKGTATPLMDGTPQVGNSNTYADALHRHPTDTTRASTAVATQISNGLMSAADKIKLDGLDKDNVTGVKGNAETAYRTGNVNLTSEDIGAVNKSGDTMTGELTLSNGQTARGYQNVAIGTALNSSHKSGFYNDAWSQYSKYIVSGEGYDKFCIGLEYASGVKIRASNNGDYFLNRTLMNNDGALLDENGNIISQSAILNKVYPVGAIYISINSTSPASLFGGSWSAITAGAFLKAVAANAGNYENAGLPNITGTLTLRQGYFSSNYRNYSIVRGADGVFNSTTSANTSGSDGITINSQSEKGTVVEFNARNSSSIYGASNTVIPYNYGVYMWRRTS